MTAGTDYGPGLYAVRLPRDGRTGRALALARQFGDYEPMEKAWYVSVILPGQHSALALEELAGLGAAITREDQEET